MFSFHQIIDAIRPVAEGRQAVSVEQRIAARGIDFDDLVRFARMAVQSVEQSNAVAVATEVGHSRDEQLVVRGIEAGLLIADEMRRIEGTDA